MSKPIDLLVIGGGPAGSTLAGLVKKHAPERRVVLLERCAGPRHHIGESLLPGLVPVLKELGVFEKIDAAGFPKKIGANYLWGKGDEVWENDFNDVNVTELLRRHGGQLPETLEYAWQVRRSKYDEILLEHAGELGVEVVRGAAAARILERGGAVAGVEAVVGGKTRAFRAAATADCSGQAGFLSRYRPVRRYDSRLKNIAVYAYWKGAPWKYRYNGHPDKTKIFVCAVPGGWFWYIPIDEGVVSVGLVTSQARLKAAKLKPEALYLRELERCREIFPLLAKAERLEDFDGAGREFHTQTDWSYLNVSAAGPGWLACGDAAVFVDPILSTGVTLAHWGAHRAAYTLLTAWRDPAAESRLWDDYNLFCRESAAQFLTLALFWYGHDRSAASWWKKAKQVQKAWLPAEMGDQTSFITVSAGLTRHYERALTAAALAEEQPPRPRDFPFYASVLPRDAALERRAEEALDLDAPARLLHPFKTELVYAPAPEGGRLIPVKRVRFLKSKGRGALADAVNPRRVVTRWHLDLLAALDGRRTARQALALTGERGAPAWWLRRQAPLFLRELSVQGVLALGGKRAKAEARA
jgi:clorobiocin biosynthesis protein Clo-hal